MESKKYSGSTETECPVFFGNMTSVLDIDNNMRRLQLVIGQHMLIYADSCTENPITRVQNISTRISFL